MFGRRAAEVVAEGARQREAEGVFLMTSGTTDDVAKVRAKFIDANKRRFGLRDGGVGPVARCQTHQPTQAAGPSEGVGPRVRIRLAPAESRLRTRFPRSLQRPKLERAGWVSRSAPSGGTHQFPFDRNRVAEEVKNWAVGVNRRGEFLVASRGLWSA